MTLTVFFTFGVSLKDWVETGLFSREIQIYQELQKRGVTVQFVTYGDIEDSRWESELPGIRLLPVYERLSRPRSMIAMLLQSLVIPWVMKPDLSTSDVFKTNQMMGAWIAVIAKLRYRKPLLVRCGYELSEFFRLERVGWWHRIGSWLLSLVVYHYADRIHVATRSDASVLVKRFRVPLDKIVLRPNYVDTTTFVPTFSPSSDDYTILFVGRFTEQKNLPLLIDAISGTDLALTVVGGGKEEGIIEKKVHDKGATVEFKGRIPNNRMPDVYRRCAIYVICSRYEGNPKTLLEAMACGCAVIGTDVPGVREIIHHGKTGILVNQDSSVLRTAILRLVEDRDLCRELGEAARKWVVQEHSLDAAVEEELHAYNALTKFGRV